MEAYPRINGSYPQNLDMFVRRYLPSVPLDPLTNQPLLYALHDGKPVIYARGQDGKDRGGTPSSVVTGSCASVSRLDSVSAAIGRPNPRAGWTGSIGVEPAVPTRRSS